LSHRRELVVDTPFGAPSDALLTGRLGDVELVFIPRHGRGHRLLPSEVPYRANIFALKSLGAELVISVSAVGSLREELKPGEIVIPDQYLDRTRGQRPGTFFGEGVVAHVGFAEPTCAPLSERLAAAAAACGVTCHRGGTYVCMEGPAFSTRAESMLYRQFGGSVIGMTALPEAKLAREAELHFATLALVTDYDCWHGSEAAVTVERVVETLRQNTANVRAVLAAAVPTLRNLGAACGCAMALADALITDPAHLPTARVEQLQPILGRYLSAVGPR
jgi:5'-methylthioadenosine phosphorylase